MRPLLPTSTFVAIVSIVGLGAGALGCDRAPPVDGLKEWAPSDHDGENRATRMAAANQAPKGDGGGVPMLVEVAWKNQCQSCHGPSGRGDGPQGPMFKAADLGREEWQAKVKDDEIATIIVTGK